MEQMQSLPAAPPPGNYIMSAASSLAVHSLNATRPPCIKNLGDSNDGDLAALRSLPLDQQHSLRLGCSSTSGSMAVSMTAAPRLLQPAALPILSVENTLGGDSGIALSEDDQRDRADSHVEVSSTRVGERLAFVASLSARMQDRARERGRRSLPASMVFDPSMLLGGCVNAHGSMNSRPPTAPQLSTSRMPGDQWSYGGHHREYPMPTTASAPHLGHGM
ncbi:hypothetical protein NESM_000294200 [Novymonas esmeraldas]|uniref:Uncharacterized protein n=1 Tax=Novymonas esmeraldas TaxID=1808958 RepID=A0AAW0FDM6_9TRYP